MKNIHTYRKIFIKVFPPTDFSKEKLILKLIKVMSFNAIDGYFFPCQEDIFSLKINLQGIFFFFIDYIGMRSKGK